ncbi:hypothetical protein BaRGS_00006672, partial [Batillaria attramentaria]
YADGAGQFEQPARQSPIWNTSFALSQIMPHQIFEPTARQIFRPPPSKLGNSPESQTAGSTCIDSHYIRHSVL